jgi:hypothetical protein
MSASLLIQLYHVNLLPLQGEPFRNVDTLRESLLIADLVLQ